MVCLRTLIAPPPGNTVLVASVKTAETHCNFYPWLAPEVSVESMVQGQTRGTRGGIQGLGPEVADIAALLAGPTTRNIHQVSIYTTTQLQRAATPAIIPTTATTPAVGPISQRILDEDVLTAVPSLP